MTAGSRGRAMAGPGAAGLRVHDAARAMAETRRPVAGRHRAAAGGGRQFTGSERIELERRHSTAAGAGDGRSRPFACRRLDQSAFTPNPGSPLGWSHRLKPPPPHATEGSARPPGGRNHDCGRRFMVKHRLTPIPAQTSPKRPPEGAVGRCPAALRALFRAGLRHRRSLSDRHRIGRRTERAAPPSTGQAIRPRGRTRTAPSAGPDRGWS